MPLIRLYAYQWSCRVAGHTTHAQQVKLLNMYSCLFQLFCQSCGFSAPRYCKDGGLLDTYPCFHGLRGAHCLQHILWLVQERGALDLIPIKI